MRLSARADYALRAAIELAAAHDGHVTAEQLAQAQNIPGKFLETILTHLRRSNIVRSQRGPDGGFWLARPASEISLADIIRAIDGQLLGVRGERPENVSYPGAAEPLQRVWIALRANERAVLESVTLADIVSGELPPAVAVLTDSPQAWVLGATGPAPPAVFAPGHRARNCGAGRKENERSGYAERRRVAPPFVCLGPFVRLDAYGRRDLVEAVQAVVQAPAEGARRAGDFHARALHGEALAGDAQAGLAGGAGEDRLVLQFGQGKVVRNLAEDLGQRRVQGGADRREKLGGGLLAATFHFRQIT
jgi:Rrf2 family protein